MESGKRFGHWRLQQFLNQWHAEYTRGSHRNKKKSRFEFGRKFCCIETEATGGFPINFCGEKSGKCFREGSLLLAYGMAGLYHDF